MAVTFQPSAYSGMVDRDQGMVSREIFVNADIYAEEQERIFTRAWLFVGHESQAAKPHAPGGASSTVFTPMPPFRNHRKER